MRPARLFATVCAVLLVVAMGVGLWVGLTHLSLIPDPRNEPTPASRVEFASAESAPTSPEAPVPGVASTTSGVGGEADAPAEGSFIAEYGVDAGWATDMAARTGINERVLSAYASAALWAADHHPTCGLEWNTLAAVGWVESRHASIHGSTVASDGSVSPAIIGIPLDGTNGTAEIRDTDAGELDEDKEFDRAVGPLQFIPETWHRFAIDARGTGSPEPQNVDDAAFAAANYLCSMRLDLADDDDWPRAILRYNASQQYVDDVFSAAEYYAEV